MQRHRLRARGTGEKRAIKAETRILITDAAAERQPVIDLERHARIDIVSHQLRFLRLETADERRVVIGLQAEGHGQTDARPQALAELP